MPGYIVYDCECPNCGGDVDYYGNHEDEECDEED